MPTFAQKALARAAGLATVSVGQVVDARPDRVLSHDNTAPIAKTFSEFGLSRVPNPHRLLITLDHAAPPPTPAHAKNHQDVRRFVKQNGIQHFFEVGRGVCHQVFSEEALVLPGWTILGSDSHTPHFGWLGAFGAGIGRSEVATVWAVEELWLRVPESVQITLEGTLPAGVTSKDLCLFMIGKWGADGGLGRSVEFTGSGLASLSLESRMVIPNMMAEFGAKNAYLPPDSAVFEYLAQRLSRRTGQDLDSCRKIVSADALYPDADAHYAEKHHIDLSQLDIMVSCPHRTDNVQPMSAVRGTPIEVAFLGTCTNGRLEDLAAAAAVVKGRKAHPNIRFIIIPASSEVMLAATQLGYTQTLLEAGAMFESPGCGPCMGNHMGIPAPGEASITSANRNFKGRMGEPEAGIYLASPAVVAASAILGHIGAPQDLE
ncbi:MAG TPA: aconitase/3-isopropylmalate dehydratase large subunit family protein [Anaerolineales bacterium]|nr:aconitase/3-isopropylmalate dehydratase large subunit family protein [Anaerolineales bacterium]